MALLNSLILIYTLNVINSFLTNTNHRMMRTRTATTQTRRALTMMKDTVMAMDTITSVTMPITTVTEVTARMKTPTVAIPAAM